MEGTPSNARILLRDLDLHPHKGLGQNFLIDRHVLSKLISAAEVSSDDIVLEIGAGLGILTQALAEHARQVVAVEIDPRLTSFLQAELAQCSNVEIVQGDILRLELAKLVPARPGHSPFKVVANIPYYITSAVLRYLLEAEPRPSLIVLMVQHQVAHRLTAQPGDMSLLSVSVQFYGRPRLVSRVSAEAFYPRPKVDSQIIRLEPHQQLPLPKDAVGPFFQLVRAGFAQKRKQLHNTLVRGLCLPAPQIVQLLRTAGIDETRRAETLSLDEWLGLYRTLAAQGWDPRAKADATPRPIRPDSPPQEKLLPPPDDPA